LFHLSLSIARFYRVRFSAYSVLLHSAKKESTRQGGGGGHSTPLTP